MTTSLKNRLKNIFYKLFRKNCKYDGEYKVYFDSEGKLHRDGKPAVKSKIKEVWYKHGEFHRIGGPCSTHFFDRHESWCQEGKYYREDGPAYISQFLSYWVINDLVHRLEGPAIFYILIRLEQQDNISRMYLADDKYIRETGEELIFEDPQRVYAVKGLKYWQFKYLRFLYLQFLIRFLTFMRKNPDIYRPTSLGGIITKNEIYKMLKK